MERAPTYIEVGYSTAQEYWEEIVLASAARFRADPTRAHAMAVAIYVSHFLDWVFHDKHPREDTQGNPLYVAFKQRHYRACPELTWLVDLVDVAKRRGLGRPAALVKLKSSGGRRKRAPAEGPGAAAPAEDALLLEMNGAYHRFEEVMDRAVAYWRKNR